MTCTLLESVVAPISIIGRTVECTAIPSRIFASKNRLNLLSQMSKIKEQWREVSNEYLKAFCERTGINIEDAWWIGDDPGTIAQIGDYFVGIHEMRYLVDNNISPDVFFKWYDYSLDIHTLQEEYHEKLKQICREDGEDRG